MSRLISLCLAVFQLAQFILERLRESRLRDEGRKELQKELEQSNEEARRAAESIDAIARDTGLDDLRERMREYQRPRDGP